MTLFVLLSILICIFNIIMWIFFFKRFKKLFSTDDVIDKARSELNSLLIQLDKSADRDISLLEDRIAKTKAIIEDADKRITLLKQELDKTEKSIVFKSLLEKEKNTTSEVSKKNVKRTRTPIDQYKNEQGKRTSSKEAKQDIPEIVRGEQQILPKKDYKRLVQELATQGMTIEEIAAKVGRSTQEIKFTLEF